MATQITTAMQNQIAQNYIAILGRNPDSAGFSFWVNQLADANNTPTAQTAIVNGFGNSTEFRSTYASLSTTAAVTLLYNNVLLRAPDSGGLTFWSNYANSLITSGQTLTNAYAQTAAAIIYNASNNGSTDSASVNARTATAVTAGTTPNTTYTLTTGVETITGASNVVVNGSITGSVAPGVDTLNAADSIILTGTGNVMNVTHTALLNTDATNGALISGVQTFNIRNASAAGAGNLVTLDATKIAALTSVQSNLSSGDIAVTGLVSGATVGVIGNGTLVNGASSFTYGATPTAATLNIQNGVTAGAISVLGAAVTTVNVNSTGAANTVAGITAAATTTAVAINATTALVTGGITGVAAATTITVSGSAANATTGTKVAVDLGTLAANATTVNASGLTNGGIALQLGAAADKITGGAGGGNVINTGAIVLTGSVAVSGLNNTLVVGAAAAVAATPAAKYTGFQTLQNTVTNATLDASLIVGVTAVQDNSAGTASGFTNLSATQGAAITVLQSEAGSQFALKDATGTSDAFTITGGSGVAATAVNVTNLNITGVETINYVNTATAASTLSFGTGSGTLKTLTLTGTGGLTVDLAAQANTDATTVIAVNASGLTAKATGTNTFTLLDTVGGHALTTATITGSAGDNAYILGGTTGTDTLAVGKIVTITGGALKDSLTASEAQLYTAGSGYIAFNGGAGTDTLIISDAAGGTVSDNVFVHATGLEALTFSNTGGIAFAAGGSFNAAFATGVTLTNAGILAASTTSYDLSLYGQATTVAITSANIAASTTTVIGGTANNKITVTEAAYTGNTGGIAVTTSTAAATDTISISSIATAITGAIVVTTNSGNTDTITTTHGVAFATANLQTFNIGTLNNDVITGFMAATLALDSDVLNLSGSSAALANLASTTATSVSNVTFTTTTGLLTLAGTGAAAVTAAQEIIIAEQALAVNGLVADTVAFVNGTNSYVVHADTASTYTVVQLVAVSATSLIAGIADTHTLNAVGIA